jgi:hypothetical protein
MERAIINRKVNSAMSPNDPKETKGFSLGFILCTMAVIGVIGVALVNLQF